MDSKEEIIRYIKGIHEQAVRASGYIYLIKTFKKLYTKHKNEMNLTSYFWSMTYNSWYDSCILYLSKIFDATSDSANIRKLMTTIRNNMDLLHDESYSITLSEDEKNAFKTEVDSQDALFNILAVENNNRRYSVNVNKSELISTFCKKYTIIEGILEKLRIQRNNIVVHNSGDIEFNEEKMAKIELIDVQDAEKIISYVLEFTQTVMYAISKEYLYVKYSNSDDIEFLMKMLHDGYVKWNEREGMYNE